MAAHLLPARWFAGRQKLSLIALINPQFLAQVRENAAYLHHRLLTLEHEEIVEVRAAGYLVGVEMKAPVAPLDRGCPQ